MTSRIALFEGMTQSAWPALSTEVFDGWLLRFANGYTKRANSVTPLYAGTLADADKLDYCERRFADAGLPRIFKLTQEHAVLDAALAERGYAQIDVSSVQTCDLGALSLAQDAAVTLQANADTAWMDAFARLSHLNAAQRHAAERMLAQYAAPTAFGVLEQAGEVLACGFAVRQHDHVLLFDICTDPAHRRQGYARRLVQSLLAWGKQRGATQGLLQVVASNEAAVALYAGFGFVEQYRYWYRHRA
ncbi:ribosomal protein S18 acetylase RimI-like enzyme [Silvimonas terrae]|uniref:Ribosomal protein S18 acetylase RimI-like enzyme n=1 Tax=Silvimonas terrae TaxID=300266 RepID=A0A840RE85_9NEIS|nr:GNAT family N-acetyltransferase [Silvimonas terrae]MBB5191297.1 ribosomal protein S18 acetylase RimI-like enzyme [Silvimonas terrae]